MTDEKPAKQPTKTPARQDEAKDSSPEERSVEECPICGRTTNGDACSYDGYPVR